MPVITTPESSAVRGTAHYATSAPTPQLQRAKFIFFWHISA